MLWDWTHACKKLRLHRGSSIFITDGSSTAKKVSSQVSNVIENEGYH